MILNRLFTRPALPSALVPTLAIELGSPRSRDRRISPGGPDVSFVACVLGGYAVLMALVQVRLIPLYRRLSVTPGSSAFTFAYAAAAADALVWLAITKPPGAAGSAIAVITLLTAFASWIAFRKWSSPSAASSFPPGHRRTDARNATGGCAENTATGEQLIENH